MVINKGLPSLESMGAGGVEEVEGEALEARS
jgi:hypothetical protein